MTSSLAPVLFINALLVETYTIEGSMMIWRLHRSTRSVCGCRLRRRCSCGLNFWSPRQQLAWYGGGENVPDASARPLPHLGRKLGAIRNYQVFQAVGTRPRKLLVICKRKWREMNAQTISIQHTIAQPRIISTGMKTPPLFLSLLIIFFSSQLNEFDILPCWTHHNKCKNMSSRSTSDRTSKYCVNTSTTAYRAWLHVVVIHSDFCKEKSRRNCKRLKLPP